MREAVIRSYTFMAKFCLPACALSHNFASLVHYLNYFKTPIVILNLSVRFKGRKDKKFKTFVVDCQPTTMKIEFLWHFSGDGEGIYLFKSM